MVSDLIACLRNPERAAAVAAQYSSISEAFSRSRFHKCWHSELVRLLNTGSVETSVARALSAQRSDRP